MTESEQKNKYLNSIFFCFSIDNSNYNKDYFSFECQNYSKPYFETFRFDNNLTVLRVFMKDSFCNMLFREIKSSFAFKIIYKSSTQIYYKSGEYSVDKNNIKFAFEDLNEQINSNLFKNTSSLEKYSSFIKFEKIQDILFSKVLDYLKINLDLELYFHLLKDKKGKEKEDLKSIFEETFPKFKIIYSKEKLKIIDFKLYDLPKGLLNKLKIIYSIIIDTTEELNDFYEDYINIIYIYNQYHKGSPIPIRKNVFNFLINELNEEKIKKVCKNCENVPILFDYLASSDPENINLDANDMPTIMAIKEKKDFMELIDKYEKIKACFKENEILKIWNIYIGFFAQNNSIEDLESIKDKFISINKQFYEKNIDYIYSEISNIGKKLIQNKKLKGFKMYEFINKYNCYCDFLSDGQLLLNIAENISLEELDNNEDTLKEYEKCKFIQRIEENSITIYINGLLEQIKTFEEFYLFFKHIYKLKIINDEKDKKYINITNSVITFFFSFLSKFQNPKKEENIKEIIKIIFLLSLMYKGSGLQNNFIDIIEQLKNNFPNEFLIEIFIDEFINSDVKLYITDDLKDYASKNIIKLLLLNLNIDKQIFFTFKIKSLELKEHYIFPEFPSIQFDNILKMELSESLIYLENFINQGILKNKEILNSFYFRELKSQCNCILDKLEKKEINFSDINKLNEIIKNNKLSNRIKYLCFDDSNRSYNTIEENIKKYVSQNIKYYNALSFLIRYYNHYFPNYKKSEIDNYKKVLQNYNEAVTNICQIEINENIYEEIKNFEVYEKSKFFKIFYNNINIDDLNQKNIQLQNPEVNKFNKSKEIFNKCKNLFNGEKLEISFLEDPLSKFKDDGVDLLEEITYLKNYFNEINAEEKRITKDLLFYKQRKNIRISLNYLKNIIKIFRIKKSNDFISSITEIIENINKIKYYEEIKDIIKNLQNLDEKILEKNFIDALFLFSQNPQLLEFLSSQEVEETQELIDGLFDYENQEKLEVLTIGINDIKILINAVSFIQEIKSKKKSIKEFIDIFHFLLDEKNEIYKDILYNLYYINIKISDFQEYIKFQYGEEYKYSCNIEEFLKKGIIEFVKIKKKKSTDILDLLLFLQGKSNKIKKEENEEELIYDAKITIGENIKYFEEFKQIINKLRSKAFYSYGKNEEIFNKVRKLSLLIGAILKELNLNVKEKFEERYLVSDLKFENKVYLKIPELENALNNLRKKNYQIKMKNLHLIGRNPIMQLKTKFDLYDLDEIDNLLKMENYFPNINRENSSVVEEIQKLLFERIMCDDCKINPIIGKRFKCKVCYNFYYCEKCMEKNKDMHIHKFIKLEEKEIDEIANSFLIFYQITKVKENFDYCKGLFFFKSSYKNYELDILSIFNNLLIDFPKTNSNDYPTSFYKKLPFEFNLLLCHNFCTESEIYNFCLRAINCISQNLFVIVRPEELNIRNENFFFKVFNILLEKNNFKINSFIIILYIDQDSHIIKRLKNFKIKYNYPDEPPIFRIMDNEHLQSLEELPIEIVTSDYPRIGKSNYIRKQSKGTFKYVIPLGEIDSKLLHLYVKALSKDKTNKTTIVFELYETDDEKRYNLLRNFLFKFIILKNYDSYNFIFENKKIFIEVSSDYINFLDDYNFLKLFKRTHIRFKNQIDFYEKNKILFSSDEMIKNFCALMYLKLLDDGKINSTNIDQSLMNNIAKNKTDSILKDYNLLIKKYFLNKFQSKKLLPNYEQINIFITLLGDLIYNLDECEDLHPIWISKYKGQFKRLSNIREKIMKSYIILASDFSSSISYKHILENQEIAVKSQKNCMFRLPEEQKVRLSEKLNKKIIITYEEIKTSIVLFNKKPKDITLTKSSIITPFEEGDEEYKQLSELYIDYLKDEDYLHNLHEFSRFQFIRELKCICSTPDSLDNQVNEKLELYGYEFTMDNFVKMILIYLRIRINIPIILLGEACSGKTSLIKVLSEFLKDRYNLLTLKIHAGFTYQDIMIFLKNNKLFDIDKFENEKNTILFIDKINTSKCLNLLTDLFTKHSFLSKPLKKNVYIIASCYPYRLSLSETKEIRYITEKTRNLRNLAYLVNPLPLSLINYVFDFGNLRDEDEKRYIKSFIDSFLNEKFSLTNNYNYRNILDKICDSVNFCHTYIRNNNDVSSVSLRDIERFTIFYGFFLNIIKRRKEFENNYKAYAKKIKYFVEEINEEQKKENIIFLKAANLSLFICYYLRIIDPKQRKELAQKLTEIFEFDFLEYPYFLENVLANNIILDKGIAKNRALLDSLFSMFVCLNNKIPIFIYGKERYSSSLSFSLLYHSMNGEYSKSDVLKNYPKIVLTSYQGSLTSTSEDIKKIFFEAKKVVKYKNGNRERQYLSVILFDEMGLVEISPNNPLNVLYSELDENAENKNGIGFVGFSNWALNISIMNRGVSLSIQEPELNDLLLTAETISYNIYEEIQNISSLREIIQNLAKSYYDYKEHLKLKYPLYNDFHGTRDFYCLIRIASKLLKNNNNKSPESISMESIERNFGGLELDLEDNTKWSSTKKFKQIFSGHQKNIIENIDKYDIFSCIQKNLTEENNRYLLLLTDRTKSDALIESIFKKLNLKFRFIKGSKLKEDQNEQYIIQKAYSIIFSMEKGEVIIIKDLENLYHKFYDLFNKNLQKLGNYSYITIALDSTTNERHLVNKNFRCIILLEKNDVKEQDPSFLNRFEKHLISFNYLLNEKQKLISKELYDEIVELTSLSENKKSFSLLVNINIEEIRCLIFELSQRINIDELEKNIVQIYKLIIPTFTQENILCSLFSKQEKFIKKEDLIKIYKENSYINIKKFLEKVEKNKIIVYTLSQFYEDIFTESNKIEINNPKFGNINKENTIEIKFNDNLSENMLNHFFQMYYEQNNSNLFIIHFKIEDTKYLKYIRFQLNDFLLKNKEEKRKIFLFIIHIEKKYEFENNKKENKDFKYHSFFFSFISEYQQITIDNLFEQRNISIIDLYSKTNEELFATKELFDLEKFIKTEFGRQITLMTSNQEIIILIEKLDNLKENGVLNCILKIIKKIIKNKENLLKKSLIDYSFLIENDFDFMSYFIERTERFISEIVEKLINELARSGYLVSFLFKKDIPQKIKVIIFSFIENLDLSKSIFHYYNVNYLIDLKIPGSRLLILKMLNLLKICKIEYINKEDEYRKKKDNKKKENKTLEDIIYEIKQFLINKLWKEKLLTEDIFKDYSREIMLDMFCLLFLNKNTKITLNKNQEELYMFLYEQKIISDDINNERLIDKFLSFFLWIGSYHEIILKLFHIIFKLNKNFISDKNLTIVQYLKNIYNTIEFPKEENQEKTIEKEKVNGIFYKMSESICYMITDINRMNYKNIENLQLFCSELNEVVQVLSHINSILVLSLRTYYSIISIKKFIEYNLKYDDIPKNNFKNQLISFIKNINDEREFISKNEIYEAKKRLIEQINIVISFSYELLMEIFVNKYLQYSEYEEYKVQLVKLIIFLRL